MTYDPIPFWQERGRTYEATFRAARYVAQERALAGVLAELDYRSVLDVGCGFGRLTRLLGDVDYLGIDVSADQLAAHPGRTALTSLVDFDSRRRFELVIACEFLMHVPPAQVQSAVCKLERLSSRYVVTVDWTTPVPKAAPHNFIHDYAALFSRPVLTIPVGLQTIHVLDKR